MIKSYFKVALRNLKRNKAFSFINIFGMSVGLACSILILIFVKDELSFDSFHKNADRIYRISLFENYSKDDQHFNSIIPGVLGPLLKSYYPEIENSVRISQVPGKVTSGAKSFVEKYELVDPAFFKMFNFPLLRGNSDNVLNNPNSVVITESYAKKYFGSSDPLGKTLSMQIGNNIEEFLVTGVAKNVPENSSIKFNILIPYQKIKEFFSEKALNSLTIVFCETYVLLKPGVTGKEMETKMPALIKSLQGEQFKSGAYNLLFQPIKDIHLDTSYPVGWQPISSPIYSYALSIIGFFILLIAGINFVTLSIGKSISRASEVGIRKVVGANRKQLIVQYWGESLMLVIISAVAGFLIAELLLPLFNNLSDKHLKFLSDPITILILLAIVLLTGLLSGIYPALVLSSFNPVQVLKGKFKIGQKSFLRRFLVCGQFTISVILIAGTIAVFKQLEFIKNKDLGFNKENILVVPTRLNMDETLKIVQLFRNELSRNKNVLHIAAAATPIGERWNMIGFLKPDGSYNRFYLNVVGYDYIKTMGLKLLKGRDFSKDFSTDFDQAVIVNEAFVKKFGLQNDSTGKMPGRFVNNKIIGVVKDFNFESLHTIVKPAALVLSNNNIFSAANDIDTNINPRLLFRIKSGNINSTISEISNTWKKLVNGITFSSSFLQDNIEKQYRTEEQLTAIISLSSILSILITCLGLFGLSILITVQKIKEIGIRKVLGASVRNILGLISKDFLILTLVANFISWPVAWLLIDKWLQNFEYKITVSYSIFIQAGIITILITLMTVSFQTIKAAIANPIKSLRYE